MRKKRMVETIINGKKISLDLSNATTRYTRVVANGKYNFCNKNGLLSKQWFDYCSDFNNGFAPVKLNDKWNLIDNQGKYISEQWFDPISFFSLTLLLFC